MTEVRILATGTDFLKENVRGTGPAVEGIIDGARKELHIMAYVISRHAENFMDLLEKALERGVKTTLVINRLEGQDEETRIRLASWAGRFPYFRLVDFDRKKKTLHAKVVVSDRDRAVIGSANFSWGGMSGNYEVGVMIQGRDAWTLSRLVDDAASSAENPALAVP